MWRWLARIFAGLALGTFGTLLLLLVSLAVIGVLAFLWIIVWSDV